MLALLRFSFDPINLARATLTQLDKPRVLGPPPTTSTTTHTHTHMPCGTFTAGNFMAVPGLDTALASAIRRAVKSLIWPQRMVVEVLPDINHYSQLMVRAQTDHAHGRAR